MSQLYRQWVTSSGRKRSRQHCAARGNAPGGRSRLYVTENGLATDDDAERINYVQRALEGVGRCLDDGIDVAGYTYWSLLDNFEWAFGYAPRFGLVEVDRTTFDRHPKDSAHWLSSVAKANALEALHR